MELQPGKTTALVGASGSGKSTSVRPGAKRGSQSFWGEERGVSGCATFRRVCPKKLRVEKPRQLIFRYYDPMAGTILIDGVPMKDWDLTHLHRHMALGPARGPLKGYVLGRSPF